MQRARPRRPPAPPRRRPILPVHTRTLSNNNRRARATESAPRGRGRPTSFLNRRPGTASQRPRRTAPPRPTPGWMRHSLRAPFPGAGETHCKARARQTPVEASMEIEQADAQAHQAAEQGGDRQRVVEPRAGIGDPQFQRWELFRGTQGPPQELSSEMAPERSLRRIGVGGGVGIAPASRSAAARHRRRAGSAQPGRLPFQNGDDVDSASSSGR